MDNKFDPDYKHNSDPYSGYTSYSQNGLQRNSEVVRSLEKEMNLQEFKDDREIIIQTLKTAIKNGEYDEARDIVYQYRAAIKTDEQFAVLAQMVNENLENRKQIEQFETRLDATPDDAFQTRLDLCQSILKYQPNSAKYLAEKARCERALGIGIPKSDATPNKTNQQDRLIACPICLTIMGFLDFAMVFGSTDEPNAAAWTICFIIAFILHFIMLSNLKINPLKSKSDGLKIGLSILLFFIIGMALV